MEIGLTNEIPTYSGGLGVLAGDTIRAAADLRVPMVAVTLLHRKGYCRQRLDADGNQTEEPVEWPIEKYMQELPARASITLEGRDVVLRAWQYEVIGYGGYVVPVIFLDTDHPENAESHRGITYYLYGGDSRYRLCQEAVLGIGGVRMLRALGHDKLARFHMNEGHAGLLSIELLSEYRNGGSGTALKSVGLESVRSQCVFTTHTPVPAGHDQFPFDVVVRVLDPKTAETLRQISCVDGSLNLTYLALHLSQYVNGVARRHGEVSRQMFAPFSIDSITNGVHARTWVAPPMQELFDEHIPTWREDAYSLRNALSIPNYQIWSAHQRAKQRLIDQVNGVTGIGMDVDTFTIGFARRAAAYKRGDLFFEDPQRLRRIHELVGPIQVLYAGKAHPHDGGGKEMIRRIVRAAKDLRDAIKIVYLADYDMELCKLFTSGVDVWLNTPEPPLEASGTSGMKAALNGIPSLSVLDGWWIEGWIEGTTGWAIGSPIPAGAHPGDRARDAESLYDKLEYVVLPRFYQNRDLYIDMMRHCIALNGSFFNAQRMMHQYVVKAYFA